MASTSPRPAAMWVLGLSVGLALALFASHLWAWTRVVALSDAVAQAQGEGILRSFAASRGPRPGPPSAEDLAAFLDAERDGGLVYVALVGPSAEVEASVGVAAHPPSADDLETLARTGSLDVGSHRWMLAPRHGGREGGRGDGPPPPWEAPPGGPEGAAADAAPGLPPGPPLQLVIEYAPTLADELRATAAGNLVLSLLAGLALLGAAVGLYRSGRSEAEARALAERSRHLASLGEMSAVLAHEIRNPLAALKGHAQLLEEQVADPVLPAALSTRARRLVDEANRLEVLTNELLDFARAGRVDRLDVDPVALARSVADELDATRVRVTAEGAPDRASLDDAKVRTALRNLVRNALQADAEGRPVEITVLRGEDGLVYRVRDHGPGFPDGGEERSFAPFVTTRLHGAGLGLAVVRRVAEMHGGSAKARNHPDGGAEVALTLGVS